MKAWMSGLILIAGCISGLVAGEPAPGALITQTPHPQPGGNDQGVVSVELKGIIKFPENPQLARMPAVRPGGEPTLMALIEFPSKPPQAWDRAAWIGEHQRQGDVEILKIDAAAGTVQLTFAGQKRQLAFVSAGMPQNTSGPPSGGPAARAAAGSIRLEHARWGDALAIYQQVLERTLLCSSAINRTARLSLHMDAVPNAETLARGIEGALPGLVFRPDGDKFMVVGREGVFEKLAPELRQLAEKLKPAAPRGPGAEQTSAKIGRPDDVVPAGMINFQNTDLRQGLQIFQELINRTVLQPALLPGSGIYLKTQTPLTREEAVYAMCAVLALDGISLVDAGDKFLFAYPTLLAARAKALFARELPSHTDAPGSQTIPPGMGNSWLDLAGVAKVYGELAGQPVELAHDLTPRHFTFRPQTTLTTNEALHALDLLLGWEGLEVVKNQTGTGLRVVEIH